MAHRQAKQTKPVVMRDYFNSLVLTSALVPPSTHESPIASCTPPVERGPNDASQHAEFRQGLPFGCMPTDLLTIPEG
jgi:hypothetical protein